MTKLRVGIIGCGRPGRAKGATGSGTAHVHAKGYVASPDCELVAAADIKEENLEAFCDKYGIAGRYLEHRDMLAQAELDVISVCVWPHLHARMVIDAAQAGVRAIHCEKPMAVTWGDAKRMAAACAEKGVQLTFNHQRRFGKEFRQAKALLDQGEQVVFVDTRSRVAYEQDHISGALSIPLTEIEARHGELPQDKKIVLYCT